MISLGSGGRLVPALALALLGGVFLVGNHQVSGQTASGPWVEASVKTDLGIYDEATSVGIQSNGKTVVAGYTGSGNWDAPVDYELALARYHLNGALDRSFGNNGSVLGDFGDESGLALGIAIQPDDRIVVIGHGDFSLARFMPDGQVDDSFGTDGRVVDVPVLWRLDSVALQTDGRIVVAGYERDHPLQDGVTIVRYLETGAIDTTFGVDGVARLSLGGDATASGLAALPDGGIVTAGRRSDPYAPSTLLVTRFTSLGRSDHSFGGTGYATVGFGQRGSRDVSYGWDSAVAITRRDRIVVAGTVDATGPDQDIALAALMPDGTLDNGFGSQGRVSTDLRDRSHDYFSDLVELHDGRLLAIGSTPLHSNGVTTYTTSLALYSADGHPAFGFGESGRGTALIEPPAFTGEVFNWDAVVLDRCHVAVASGQESRVDGVRSADFGLTIVRIPLAATPIATPTPGPSPTPVQRPGDDQLYLPAVLRHYDGCT